MKRPSAPLVMALAAALSFESSTVLALHPDLVVQVFNEDGLLESQAAFRQGQKVGRFVSFWPEGNPRVEAFYDGDRIAGIYRAWHRNGRPAEVRRYDDGRESGVQRAWTADGELFLNFEVRNGRRYGLVNSRPCTPVAEAM